MIYGLVFMGHTMVDPQEQRNAVSRFAEQHKLKIDQFVSFNTNPNFRMFKSGDTVICYAWDCLCKETTFLRMFMQYLVKNSIYLYSVTNKYCIDKTMDVETLCYAFAMYEDIRVKFWSNKTLESAKKRTVSGRRVGSKNKTHVLDGKEKRIWNLYSSGASMYAIAKKMKVSAPTIKRFLVTQSKKINGNSEQIG